MSLPKLPTLSECRSSIVSNWSSIVRACNLSRSSRARALGALPKLPKLLGSSTKVELGRALGVLSSVIYMSPDRELFGARDGRSSCPNSTSECVATCLGKHSGRMIMRPNERARVWKTALFFGARPLWRELFILEALSLKRRADRLGMLPAIRADGATDLGEGQRLSSELESLGIQAWDYTKSIARVRALGAPRSELGAYSLTFSYSGSNALEAREALELGFSVAVVFRQGKGEELPKSVGSGLFGRVYPVVDGDETDCRFYDRSELGAPSSGGYIVGLRFKSSRSREEMLERAPTFVV